MGLLVGLDQFLPLFTENSELTTATAPTRGDANRADLPLGVGGSFELTAAD